MALFANIIAISIVGEGAYRLTSKLKQFQRRSTRGAVRGRNIHAGETLLMAFRTQLILRISVIVIWAGIKALRAV
jgi:hypothetical protein